MSGRLPFLLATAWVFLLTPVLCAGGVLLHECGTCAPGAACNHEPECPDDPCSPVLTRSDDGPRVPTDLAPIAAPSAAVAADPWMIAPLGVHPPDLHAQPIHTPRYADTGLPLLI